MGSPKQKHRLFFLFSIQEPRESLLLLLLLLLLFLLYSSRCIQESQGVWMFLSFFFFVSRTFLVAFGCFAPLLLFFLSFFLFF
ncbi:uncharacterized protein RNJ42_01782 [Nakaseomyces bracarensis]|uniref:uncharacterized protein n=1 Tax=Nakaseomyces bracarensis TaxID=273131 RepID=UPI003872351C